MVTEEVKNKPKVLRERRQTIEMPTPRTKIEQDTNLSDHKK